MNENKSKRREWVKTAAIIFLSVLLILTFFSQTILNHSLPEVSTKYVQNGSITSKIRGSGVVESGDPYTIEIESRYMGRKVSVINFRTGDKVEKGDVLFTLAQGDGTELEEAKEKLKLVEETVDTAQKTLKDLQAEYDDMVLKDKVSNQDVKNLTAYRNQINELRDAMQAQVDKQKPYKDAVDQLTKAIEDSTAQRTHEVELNDYAEARVTVSQTALDLAVETQANAEKAVKDAKDEITKLEAESDKLEADYEANKDAFPDIDDKRKDVASRIEKAKKALEDKNNDLKKADEALKKAQDEVEEANKAQKSREASSTINNLDKAISDYTIQKHNNQNQVDAYQKEIDKIQGQIDELMAMNDDIAKLQEKQDSIDGAKKTLSEAKKSMEEAKKKVEELSDDTVGTEIKSDIAGTITAINVTSGKKIDTVDVVTIQPEGMGYFFTMNVSNEQAKLVSVGDKATLVNSWYYNDMDITLKSIKTCKTDPGKSKTLTFSVEGDSVMVGQDLNISVGQKNQEYDCIVPKSALRQDINGDYVLIIESKSTPLGNRYIARRVDVQILAQDDTQAAVSGALNTYADYVITTGSAPVDPGDQVRITEN